MLRSDRLSFFGRGKSAQQIGMQFRCAQRTVFTSACLYLESLRMKRSLIISSPTNQPTPASAYMAHACISLHGPQIMFLFPRQITSQPRTKSSDQIAVLPTRFVRETVPTVAYGWFFFLEYPKDLPIIVIKKESLNIHTTRW
jgi:hypothetical protein